MKQLSKHNTGAYRKTCRELGFSIEVVARHSKSEAWTNDEGSVSTGKS